MDLIVALDELRKARQLVKDGQEYLVNQRKLVAQLERQGRGMLEDVMYLEGLQQMQEQYEAHRDRLEQQVLTLVKPNADVE